MKFINKKLALAVTMCALGSCFAGAEAAEIDTYDISEFVVTATRTKLEEKKVPMSTQVITAETIKELGVTNVREALRASIGLDVQEAGMTGNKVQIRGMATNHTLLLVDGKRMAGENTSATANVYELNRVNIQDVERIEIVRGAGSAMYGSDAMAGVINIITKKATKAGGSLGLYTGTKENGASFSYATGKQGKLSMKVSGNLQDRRKITSSSGITNMHGPRRFLNVAANYDLGNNKGLDFEAGFMREQFRALDGTNIEWYNNNRSEYSLSYYGSDDRNDYRIRTYYNTLKKSSEKHVPTGWDKKTWSDWDRNAYDTLVVEAQNSAKLDDRHTLTYGAEYSTLHNEGTRIGSAGSNVKSVTKYNIAKYDGEKDLETYSAFVQDEWQVNDKLFVIPSLRFDNHSSFGSHWSPKLGATYSLSDNARIKVNYGQGYRAPSIAELYYAMRRAMGPFVVNVYGNPDLQPERSTNFDINFEAEKDKLTGKAGFFYNKVKDLINSQSTRVGRVYNSRYVNVDEAEIMGAEAELGYNFDNNWSMKATYTYLDAVDKGSDSRLEGRARQNGTLQLRYTDNAVNPLTVTLWDQLYVDYLTSDENYTYNTLNLSVSKQINKNFSMYAAVDNIFNKEFAPTASYAIDGRIWRLGAEFTF